MEDIFIKNMKGVKPLKKEQNKTKKIKTKKQSTNKTIIKNSFFLDKASNKKQNVSELDLTFSDLNKDLKKGRIKIDRRLDLHGFTLLEAHEKFKNEIIKNYNNNKRCLLIITGKGAHKKFDNFDEEKPKLFYGKIKNSIIQWINEADIKKLILTYQDAGIEHGGDGALFVYLRKKKF